MLRHARLLDIDRGLGEALHGRREQLATQHLVVRLEGVGTGIWTPAPDEFDAIGGFGLIIVEGLAVRQVSLGRRAGAELLGPGDLLRPWDDDGEHAAYPFAASLRVLEPLTLAVLDGAASRKLSHFPEVLDRLLARTLIRSRRLAGYLVVAQLTSVDTRLHVALWHMADRFGKVRPDGVLVPLRITHEVLGLIIGARRPSVTAALGRLVERQLVKPIRGDGWLLSGQPPQSVLAWDADMASTA